MSEEKFICLYCGKEFLSVGLSLHERLCNLNPNKIKSAKSYKICDKCGEEISTLAFNRHYKSCDGLGKRKAKENAYHLDHDDLICKFCGKECKNKNSLAQHECRCRENSDAYDISYITCNTTGNILLYNEKIKSGEITVWNKGLTKETNDSLKRAGEKTSKNLKEHPEMYNGFLGYHPYSPKWTHYGTYKNFYCDSGWELAVVVYCLENNIAIERNNKGFKYIYNNKKHTYYPDFIIDGIYTEVKGYWNDYEELKKLQFPYKLIILDENGIKPYLLYTIDKYGKNFAEILYDKDKPNYLDDSGRINYKYFN